MWNGDDNSTAKFWISVNSCCILIDLISWYGILERDGTTISLFALLSATAPLSTRCPSINSIADFERRKKIERTKVV